MEIEAFLADSAALADGKLYVQGAGWNIIHARSLPTRHSRIGIGVIIHVPYTATNEQHQLTIRLEDADGQVLALGDAASESDGADAKVRSIDAGFNIGRPPTLAPGSEQLLAFAVNLDGLIFERETGYRFVFEIDGTEVKALSFSVNQIRQMAGVG